MTFVVRSSNLGSSRIGLCRRRRKVLRRVIVLCFFISLFHDATGHSCMTQGQCDPSTCEPPEGCDGGLVPDYCGCCQVCARQTNQTCGGQFQLYGRCDHGLICVVELISGQLVTGDEQGVCKMPADSCQSLHSTYGCNIVADRCRCSNISSCSTPEFEFKDMQGCEIDLAVRFARRDGKDMDCSDVRCDVIHEMKCPSDSKVVSSSANLGECCPAERHCQCDSSTCDKPPKCPDEYDLVKIASATVIPGRCCDRYECQLNGKNCTGVKCQSYNYDCPEDSYRLPSIISADSCCSIPQGCSCLPNQCKPVSCPGKSHVKILKYSTGKPGSCCHVFTCVDVSDMSCIYDGERYESAAVWSPDNCKKCHCVNGLVFCRAIECEDLPNCGRMAIPDGQCCPVCIGCVSMSGSMYNNSETWKEDDCTTCTCTDGQVNCQAASCQVNCKHPRKIPGQCCPVCDEPTIIKTATECPPLKNCTKKCKFGMVKDSKDCFQCQCAKDDIKKCDKNCQLTTDSATGELACQCTSPLAICPQLDDCQIHCEYGYKTDKIGCQRCRCNRCPKLKTCFKNCPYGFHTDGHGCPVCKCREIKDTDMSNELAGENSCLVDLVAYEEGASWFDGCRQCYCYKGKEMCALITCPVPKCSNPAMKKGQCCPQCAVEDLPTSNSSGAMMTVCQAVDGNYYLEGETWLLNKCTECICHGGHVLCDVPSCAPAPCPKPIYDSNRCCPYCPEKSQPLLDYIEMPCLSEDGLTRYEDGTKWQPTSCRSCTCNHGYIDCYSLDCSVVKCNRPVLRKNQCCPVCLDSSTGDSCKMDNAIYSHEEKWSVDSCTSCTCLNGQVMCTKTLCNENCKHPIRTIGECCPICQENLNGSNINETKRGSNTIYIPTKNVNNKSDMNPTVAKPQQPRPYLLIICLTIISILVLTLVLVFFCCWKQRKKLLHYKHTMSSSNSKPRPKSTNLDYSHDKNTYCSSLYMEKNNLDCDYSMLNHTGHYNPYTPPPVKNV